jgi:hypothetical protein
LLSHPLCSSLIYFPSFFLYSSTILLSYNRRINGSMGCHPSTLTFFLFLSYLLSLLLPIFLYPKGYEWFYRLPPLCSHILSCSSLIYFPYFFQYSSILRVMNGSTGCHPSDLTSSLFLSYLLSFLLPIFLYPKGYEWFFRLPPLYSHIISVPLLSTFLPSSNILLSYTEELVVLYVGCHPTTLTSSLFLSYLLSFLLPIFFYHIQKN